MDSKKLMEGAELFDPGDMRETPKRGVTRVIDENGNPIEEPEVEKEEVEEETPEGVTEDTSPDWKDATSVLGWYGGEIIRLIGLARRKDALNRLRALSSSLDVWARLCRLSADTSELVEIRKELDELKREIENEKRTGPKGLVKK